MMKVLSIPAGDSNLKAFLHPAPSGANRPVLIVCHGFCGSVDGGSSLELAAAVQTKDLALLRFCFTPQCCLSQQVLEINAVLDFCRNNISTEIALLGRSMGAAASLACAAKDLNLAGLCLMASPSDLAATFRNLLGSAYTTLERGESVTGFYEGGPVHLTPEFIQDFDNYDLLHAARNLSGIPLLIVHGLNDDTIPVEQGRKLYAAAGNPKQLLLLPHHSHSFAVSAERFVPNVADWLSQTVFPVAL